MAKPRCRGCGSTDQYISKHRVPVNRVLVETRCSRCHHESQYYETMDGKFLPAKGSSYIGDTGY